MVIRPEEQRILDDFAAQHPDLHQLHSAFVEYAAGPLDAMPRPRYGQHDPLPVFTPDEHVQAFGIDTSHRLHPIRQLWVASNLMDVDYPNLSATDRKTLELTAIVHDMGEATSKDGDTITGTPKDEDDETRARHEILRAIAPEEAERIIDRTDPVLLDRRNPNYVRFELSERVGYLLTAQRAALIHLRPRDKTIYDLSEAQRMVAAVIATDTKTRNVHRVEGLPSRLMGSVLSSALGVLKASEAQFQSENPELHESVVKKATY